MRALAIVSILLGATVASADTRPGTTLTVPTPREAFLPHATAVGYLYLNRCVGGCTVVKQGLNDARSRASTIPEGAQNEQFSISEFAWGDTEWNAIVRCMKEVYSPYQITVSDAAPPPGVPYNEAIIAGVVSEIGRSGALGIAPVLEYCTPYNYTISFSFANMYGPTDRVFELCATAAQESGHSFGLDHTYAFQDGSSGCRDPMTYRGDCGGQKFFRNDVAVCGEYEARTCYCGGNQNSHVRLLEALGPGTPLTPPPTVSVTQPAAGATIADNAPIVVTAAAQRGVKVVEIWLNGYLWKTIKGAAWGPNGQPETAYSTPLPPGVPDGVIDIVIKAKDDIDATTTAPTIRVTKGAPCTAADQCAAGQQCDGEGRCFWEPAVGEIGDACTYPQFCLSETCQGTATEQRCTQSCILGVTDSCPASFACLDNGTSPSQGICWPAATDDGGCSTGSGSSGAPAAMVLVGLAGLLITRRRR